MGVSRRAALLLGWTCVAASPALAQSNARATVEIPRVPPQSTAAKPLAVPPPPPAPGRPAGPAYIPDGGGKLSGLPYDRNDPPAPAPAPVRTLAEAVTLAYRTNPELLSGRALARSTDYRVPAARAAYGLSIDATGSYTFRRDRTEFLPGFYFGNQGWTSTAALILTQPIFTFGRNAAAESVAIASSRYQRDLLRLTEAQILGSVVTAYVAVLRDAQAVTIARENLALLERQLSDSRTRYEVRDLTQTDLDQTRTRVEFGRAQLLQAEGQLGVSQMQFQQFVGAPPGELAPADLLDVKFGSLDAAYAYGEANSALIRAARGREKISRAGVEQAKAEFRPRLDLRGTADYGTAGAYSDSLRTTQLLGQVTLTAPLVDTGLRNARLAEAREANQSDWRLVDQSLRETRSAIGSAWDQLASTRASLANYQAAVAAAESAYQGALLQQRAGDRSTLDVLDLARDLLTIRTNYNIAFANEYLARASLLQAAGMLEGPLLIPGLPAYDADDHYDRVRGKSDFPLLTPALSALDRIVNRDTLRDRPSRDAGAEQAIDQSMPLPAPPPPAVPN